MVSARVVLPEPFGPEQRDLLAALDAPRRRRARARLAARRPSRRSTAGVFISSTTRAEGVGCGRPRCRRRASRAGRLHVALDALDLGELGLGLLGLELLGVEAVVEALELLDLLLVLLVAAGDQVVARRRARACRSRSRRRSWPRRRARGPARASPRAPAGGGRGSRARRPWGSRAGTARATPPSRCRGGWSARRAAGGRRRPAGRGPASRA